MDEAGKLLVSWCHERALLTTPVWSLHGDVPGSGQRAASMWQGSAAVIEPRHGSTGLDRPRDAATMQPSSGVNADIVVIIEVRVWRSRREVPRSGGPEAAIVAPDPMALVLVGEKRGRPDIWKIKIVNGDFTPLLSGLPICRQTAGFEGHHGAIHVLSATRLAPHLRIYTE